MTPLWALFLALIAVTHAETPGCKIRVTSKALELVKQEGLKFLEQELETITIPDLRGSEGPFSYNISEVKVTKLQLVQSELYFQPTRDLILYISNASIGLRFRRQLLYWFLYDGGYVDASAEGVSIHTALQLARDPGGRIKVSNVSCGASVSKMQAAFGGTFKKVYDFLSTFIISGMRFLLNQQICPVLHHAGLVLLNSLLDTVPVRSAVDQYVGIDYSLLSDPVTSASNLDMDFRGAFFPLVEANTSFPNRAVEPQLQEEERMVYVAFSEFFFDSAMDSYFRAGVLRLELAGDKVPKDLDMVLRATFFGSIILLSPAVIDAPLKLELQPSFHYSFPSSPYIILKLRSYRTKRGVQIPLPEGIDFVKEVVTNQAGFLTIGADLHFTKGLREVIEKNRPSGDLGPTSSAPQSVAPTS
ncbi:phospholipid transfer protein [Petaurus breviceps papuanus]|uniref:phospholipid transfer protein n=1 Tax=Petaurus breviceps papuanus TaxID=3040969 RepID=UPI0036DC7B1C